MKDQPDIGSPIEDVSFQLMRSLKRHSMHRSGSSNRLMQLLSLIVAHDGSKASELANLMGIRPSSLTEKIIRLEEDGLITRVKDDQDQRIQRVFITKEGSEHVKDIVIKEESPTTNILTPKEEEQFILLCKKLTKGLNQKADQNSVPMLNRDGHGPRRGHGHGKNFRK